MNHELDPSVNPETGSAEKPSFKDIYGGLGETESGVTGVTAEGMKKSLSEDAAEIGSPDEVDATLDGLATEGAGQNLVKEVNDAANEMSGRVDAFRKGPESNIPNREKIQNRLFAVAIKGYALGETTADKLVLQDTRDQVENSLVGAVMVGNVDGIPRPENQNIHDHAAQIANEFGGSENASNATLELVGAEAKNAGVTLDIIEEAVGEPEGSNEESVGDKNPEESTEIESPEIAENKVFAEVVDRLNNNNTEAAASLLLGDKAVDINLFNATKQALDEIVDEQDNADVSTDMARLNERGKMAVLEVMNSLKTLEVTKPTRDQFDLAA